MKHCDAKKQTGLDESNSQICEQSFRWLARFRYSTNHMTPARFAFFLIVTAEKRNEILFLKRNRKEE